MTRSDAIRMAARLAASTFETQAVVYVFDRYNPAEGYNVHALTEAVDQGNADDVVEIVKFERDPAVDFQADPVN